MSAPYMTIISVSEYDKERSRKLYILTGPWICPKKVSVEVDI